MTKKNQIPLMVRLEPELHAKIKELAIKERRSLNSQLETLVQEALACRHLPPTPAPGQGR